MSVSAQHRIGSSVVIRPVACTADVRRFIRMTYPLYRNDPYWVAPLEIQTKAFLDPKQHPFYLHGSATPFLAERDGSVVGRILVSDDPHHHEMYHSRVGQFGMFESIDDAEVANAILDTAASWQRERGNNELAGPIDYSMNYACGTLIEGFDTPPRIMMNHNPPYYPKLLEQWGLKKAKDLYCWWFGDELNLLDKWKRRADWLTKRLNIRIRPFNLKNFHAEVDQLCQVYDQAFSENWGFVKLSPKEFQFFGKEMRQIAFPGNIPIAEIDGKIVGFAITLPDLNEAIQPLHGRLTTYGLPIGLFRFLWRIKRVKNGRMLVLVMLNEFRGKGIEQLLILETCRYGKEVLGYQGAELGWTLENNEVINRTIQIVGGKHYKTYRIYQTAINQPKDSI